MTRSALFAILFAALLAVPAHAQSTAQQQSHASAQAQPSQAQSSQHKATPTQSRRVRSSRVPYSHVSSTHVSSTHHRAVRRTAHRSTSHHSTAHHAEARTETRAENRTETRTAHRRVHHSTSRRLARARHTRHPSRTHARREARLRHSVRGHSAARKREAAADSHGSSSAASALALTLASPAFAHASDSHAASPSAPHLEHSAPRLAHSSAPDSPEASPDASPDLEHPDDSTDDAAADIPPIRPAGNVPPDSPVEVASFHPERIVPTPPLRGTLASLERQNERTQADGLERILNNTDLNDRISRGFLVPVPVSGDLTVNDLLPLNHRYCRPWTADFLTDLSRAHEAEFHSPLEVSSAVRTIDYQKRLERTNGNAASAVGEIVSPHVTGATIDITKKGMSTREIYWMRIVLRGLQQEGKLDVEEEFHQSCFHITVYKSYLSRNALRQARRRELSTEAADDSSS